MSLSLGRLFRRVRTRFHVDYNFKDILNRFVKRLPKILLILLLSLTVFYIFLHPIDKIKVKFFLTRSCTIQVRGEGAYKDHDILIDGKFIKIGSAYYEIDGDDIYVYRKGNKGEWEKTLYSGFDDFAKKGSFGDSLFKVSSYKRVKGKLFSWELNTDVVEPSKDFSNVTLKREDGIISLVGYEGRDRVAMRFCRFGTTHKDLPWEEEE